MSDRHTDINDDEIRVISAGGNEPPRPRRRLPAICVAVIAVTALAAIAALWLTTDSDDDDEPLPPPVQEAQQVAPMTAEADTVVAVRAYTAVNDTTVNGIGLRILTPVGARPSLEIGTAVFGDSTVVLAAQAADIRSDNGRIAGAYVMKGELLSKGEAKAGFCSIVNGEITVGVADATPMLEQALASDGYFFRQYPLVVGGQLVENRPKGRAVRKALAELDGRICVITSKRRLTFHDFSQALIDLGVRNAIYLVGSSSTGLYTEADGRRTTVGQPDREAPDNINFIVWR